MTPTANNDEVNLEARMAALIRRCAIMVKSTCIFLLFFLGAGCARVNRYHADFYGQARVVELSNGGAADVPGVVGVALEVQYTRNVKVIGHDNSQLPLPNYVAILAKGNKPLRPTRIPTNSLVSVRGVLDLGAPRTKPGEYLMVRGTRFGEFHPILRVEAVNVCESNKRQK